MHKLQQSLAFYLQNRIFHENRIDGKVNMEILHASYSLYLYCKYITGYFILSISFLVLFRYFFGTVCEKYLEDMRLFSDQWTILNYPLTTISQCDIVYISQYDTSR